MQAEVAHSDDEDLLVGSPIVNIDEDATSHELDSSPAPSFSTAELCSKPWRRPPPAVASPLTLPLGQSPWLVSSRTSSRSTSARVLSASGAQSGRRQTSRPFTARPAQPALSTRVRPSTSSGPYSTPGTDEAARQPQHHEIASPLVRRLVAISRETNEVDTAIADMPHMSSLENDIAAVSVYYDSTQQTREHGPTTAEPPNLLAIIYGKFSGHSQHASKNTTMPKIAYTFDSKQHQDRTISMSEFLLLVQGFLPQQQHRLGHADLKWLFTRCKRLTRAALEARGDQMKSSVSTPRLTSARHMRPVSANRPATSRDGYLSEKDTERRTQALLPEPLRVSYHVHVDSDFSVHSSTTDSTHASFDEFLVLLVQLALHLFGYDAGKRVARSNDAAVRVLAQNMGLTGCSATHMKRRCDLLLRRTGSFGVWKDCSAQADEEMTGPTPVSGGAPARHPPPAGEELERLRTLLLSQATTTASQPAWRSFAGVHSPA